MSTDEMKSTGNENDTPDRLSGINIGISLPTPTRYINPAGTEYPVIAYNSVQMGVYVNHESLKEATEDDMDAILKTVADCGFNVNMWVSGHAACEELLNTYFQSAYYNKLTSILNVSGRLPKVVEDDNGKYYDNHVLKNILTLYRDNVNLWGYMLTDEPSYDTWAKDIDGKTDGSSILKEAYETYKLCSNGKFGFFDLAVSLGEKNIGPEEIYTGITTGKGRYQKYLENLVDKIQPLMLSVNLYPIQIKGEDLDAVGNSEEVLPKVTIKNEYYFAMEALGTVSKSRNIPAWLYIKSNESVIYNDDGSIHHIYPWPTEGILRFQVMNALAYGIQGIVFWTYGMVANKCHDNDISHPSELYLTAPIVNYSKTGIWNNCRTVVNEIKEYGLEFLNAKFQEARYVCPNMSADEVRDKEIKKLKTIAEGVGSFKCIFMVKLGSSDNSVDDPTGKGFLITHLINGGIDYLAIVNQDWEASQKIDIKFDPLYKWVKVKGECEAKDGSAHINPELKPGGMLLISYKYRV